ncbi:hypothetical protein [Serratia fonticola]|uniref:hypothetical protein n=1 Tax=Serratia fonticola TaxID=47917 RepID=UPI003AAAD2AB
MAVNTTTKKECLAELQKKWMHIFNMRFNYFLNLSEKENNYTKSIFDASIVTLSNLYNSFSNLKDPLFDNEILLDSNGQYEQRMAEVLFYYQLRRMGFKDIKSNASGPDFYCEKNGEKYCFEVVTPTPSKMVIDLINKENVDQDERSTIFKERMLSVTSAINRKVDDYHKFKSSNIITGNEKYIVVVNDSLLLPYNKPWYGMMNNLCIADSSLPIVVDATLGAGMVDFDLERYSTIDTIDKMSIEPSKKMIVKSNFSVSINNQEPSIAEDGFLYINIKNRIRTRNDTNDIEVKIIESSGVSGFYQITLREDFFFLNVIPAAKNLSPISALISRKSDEEILKKAIFHRDFYSESADPIQPSISPALIIGMDSDEFNNRSIYNSIYSKLAN